MAIQEELRAQIIKQFAADVVVKVVKGEEYYACPTCKRKIAMSYDKCPACEQVLKWDNIQKAEIERVGVRKATLTFEVSGDFVKSDCRKCPLSFIAKRDNNNVYECPLGMRNECPIELE